MKAFCLSWSLQQKLWITLSGQNVKIVIGENYEGFGSCVNFTIEQNTDFV